ncbi:DUF4227 family protein [Paenibacillus sp. NPDC056579]|uniref:DUF4227 family protein n=1 Tax=Paenibacillus sp. NPDC056579 TaxID=3345871 RepID=UPI0036CABBFF
MIFSFRKLKDQMKFMVVFVVFTYALYHLLVLVTHWIEPTHRYRQPAGKAVKVFQDHVMITDQGPMGERLKLFYWLGE